MLKRLLGLPGTMIKFPGLKYGAPQIPYLPEDRANKPVIVLFGWLGASERHLGKYTALYHSKGYETIHYIPPMPLILFPERIADMNERIQADLTRIMREKGLLRRPFLLHIFSNSGYINWTYFHRYIRKEVPKSPANIYNKLLGTVVDSAPCNLDPVVLTRGFLGALLPKVENHHHWFWSRVMEFFWRIYFRLPGKPEAFAQVNTMMDNTILPYPQWYLFSSGDTMVYSSEIKKHIHRQEMRFHTPIQSVDFVTSNHVAHYREYPFEYSKRIDAILTKVESNLALSQKIIMKDSIKARITVPKAVHRALLRKTKKVQNRL